MDETLRQARNRDAIGRFVGHLAHDFNNLLMVFQSGIALLEHPLDPETRARLFDGMRRALAQCSTLTRRMREFSEHRSPDAVTVDLAELLPGIRQRLSETLGGDIRLELDCERGLDRVKLSVADLELALLNLCLNAQEALPASGTVRIGARKTAEGVAISVSDAGRGMSEEVRARAFEPFFSTRRANSHSGLGLSQVYAFALQSDGRASLTSETGRGTTVEIVLPRAPSQTE